VVGSDKLMTEKMKLKAQICICEEQSINTWNKPKESYCTFQKPFWQKQGAVWRIHYC